MTNKAVATITPDPFLEMVERVSSNPDIDADKLQKVLDMQVQVLDRNARQAFFVALNKVQADLPQVARDAANDQTHSMYAKLETISKAVTPVLTGNGFSTSFSQANSEKDGYMRIQGVLRHVEGHSETYFVDLPPDDAGIKGNVNKTPLHAAGSTFTYGRRYLKCLMVDVAVGDDTDGNLPSAFLSAEQADELRPLFDKLPKKTQSAFLKWALSKTELDGTETVDDLNADYFGQYKENLQKKVAKLSGNS